MNDTFDHHDILSEAGIVKALELVRLRIAESERARKVAEEAIGVAREEERLLSRLLALRTGVATSVPESEIQKENQPTVQPKPAVSAVIEELEAAGRPVHVSELMRLLQRRNVPIPGAGKQANLISHMSRDDRIVRPTRGMYGLRSWGLEDVPGKRSRRRAKRVRVSAEGRMK